MSHQRKLEAHRAQRERDPATRASIVTVRHSCGASLEVTFGQIVNGDRVVCLGCGTRPRLHFDGWEAIPGVQRVRV